MMIEDLIRKTRSCRRFYQNHDVEMEKLEGLVNLGRLSSSAGNLQPLKYIISTDKKTNELIFNCLSWAKHLKDWKCPEEGEKPRGYIVMLGDKTLSTDYYIDCGIAAQSIMLGARGVGLAGCVIRSIDRVKLGEILKIPPDFEILLVVVIGKPKENIVIDSLKENGDIRYWRDEKGVHHVPKRDLNQIIVSRYG